jgi:hypothetical protein
MGKGKEKVFQKIELEAGLLVVNLFPEPLLGLPLNKINLVHFLLTCHGFCTIPNNVHNFTSIVSPSLGSGGPQRGELSLLFSP